ncbi:hypothetical protein NXF25_019976 [Crotalus adamanteus]|uniref:CCHC-type domain-containing protein n=1 Tax=Crotalus adamanteus TaxID=8729 RepID=A0AAW1B3L9_CROAD
MEQRVYEYFVFKTLYFPENKNESFQTLQGVVDVRADPRVTYLSGRPVLHAAIATTMLVDWDSLKLKLANPQWFRTAVELEAGLREFPETHDEQPQSRRTLERQREVSRQTPTTNVRPKAVFRCFWCNRLGHRVAECPVPVPSSTPTAIGKPGATPRKVTERSRVSRQTEQTPSQQAPEDSTPVLEEYDDGASVEDPMVPSARQCRLAGPRGRAFSVVAPTWWNQLPPEVRTTPTLPAFKKAVKTLLFRQAWG